MRSNKGDLIPKESILKDVQECVNSAIDKGSCEVHTKAPIIVSLNNVLKTGLRENSRGYWHIVQQYTHSSELDVLNKFFNPTFTYQEKGITWLCYTLVEGSLLGYISSLILDIKALQRYYYDFAFLRDHVLVIKFISVLHKLSTVALSPISDGMADEFLADEKSECKKVNESLTDLEQKNTDYSDDRCRVSIITDQHSQDDLFLPRPDTFNLRLLPEQPQSHQLPPPMTSSIASLTSPVDSGVALVDSDIDNTSLSEVTLDNDKVEDDLPFTSMEESGIIWGESDESKIDSVANSVTTQICNDGLPFEYSSELENTSASVLSPTIQKMGSVDNFDLSNEDMKTSLYNDKNHCKNENKSTINENPGGDEIVFRRTKGRKTKKEKSKCVSFHEDSNKSEIKNVSFCSDNKRLSMNDDINWSLKNETSFITEDEVDKENHNNSKKENILINDSSNNLIDSEIGVEVDCESNSSTVTEVSSNKKPGIYKKLNDIVKQRFESIHSKMNKSEPEIFYGSTSSLNLNRLCETSGNKLDSCRSHQKHAVQKRNSLGHMLKSIKGQWLIPVSERGVPEGQEDPQKFSSTTSLNEKCMYNVNSIDLSSDSEWSSDADECVKKRNSISYQSGHKGARRNLWPSRSLREALSKTSLVNKFLQSIPEGKVNISLALNRKRFPLYIKGVKADQELAKQLLEELNDEIKNNKVDQASYSVQVDDNLQKAIFSNILVSSQEKIYKVYKVSSVDGLPLLCILSDSSLYVTGISPINQTFYNHHVIPYSQLNSIIIGPNSQVMMLAVTDRSHRVTVLTTFGQNMVNELLSHLELAVRRAIGTSTIAVQELSLENMVELKRMIVKQSSVQKSEDLEHYVWVNVGDSTFIPSINPLGPTKSGHLMFRPHRNSSWLPGYVLLKAGVLYVFADANQRLPNHAVPLHSGQCGGCRRVPHPSRPHTFEIILPLPGNTFQLAAADEYEVSDWLQAFVQAASGDSDSEVIHDELSEAIMGCGLLLTTNHILTLSFPHKVLACAQLQYISSIKLAFNCCVLETGCREICEGGGDWVIYFATDLALEEFLNNLVRLQPSLSEAIIMMSESDPLNIRCEQTSKLLEESWQLLLNPQIT